MLITALVSKKSCFITRGKWGRDSGGGDYRNYCKGHMDKTKGEGRSRGGREVCLVWGENADKFNLTTIK